MKTSKELKAMIHDKGFVFWQIAEKIGVSENTVIRWMRGTPTADHAARIEKAVMELTQESEE